jgi:hydroxymethylbilane synthase
LTLTFATRPSALARRQTRLVIQALERIWPGLEITEQVITTSGDRILDKPLPEIGGKGLFTQELEAALLGGEVDVAVHSLKDLPVEAIPGLTIAAIPARGEARDALLSASGSQLQSLPPGARVGTSSLRRSAQLLAARPDLEIAPLRGNVDTRLRKLQAGQYDAVVLAGAGLIRLGLETHITHWLPLDLMTPAPGQGALAVQCRSDDSDTGRLLSALDHLPTHQAVTAERAFLSGLGGGCSLPVGAYAILENAVIELHGVVASIDGGQLLRLHASGRDPQQLGLQLARQALTEGAAGLLKASLPAQPTS